MPERSRMEAIYILSRLVERLREKIRDPDMVLIDLEKSYDMKYRRLVWHVLEKKHVHELNIDEVKAMYDGGS